MAEIIWVGPGWYKLLSFAVGEKKVVQISQNKAADLDSACFWCKTITDCAQQFEMNRERAKSKRITY